MKKVEEKELSYKGAEIGYGGSVKGRRYVINEADHNGRFQMDLGIDHYFYSSLAACKKAITERLAELGLIKFGGFSVGVINLNGDRRLINACKKAGLKTFNPQGDYNGFGYERLPLACRIHDEAELKTFLKVKKELSTSKVEKKFLSPEEIKLAWAKRLAKLTEIDIETAIIIADEKIEYHEDKVFEMIERDNAAPSIRRGKLISKMERENPLRYIKNAEHAFAILAASERHRSTNYEYLLEEARELAAIGDLDRNEVKEYARSNFQHI
jgi:hypothetical protein